MALWPHYTLPQNSFLYSFFKGGLWIISDLTLKPGGWNSIHNQLGPRDVQPCPVFLSCLSNQIHKAKSWKNINVIVTLSRTLNLQGLFWAAKREHIRFIQASLRPQPYSARGSLKKHKTLIYVTRRLRKECFSLDCRCMLSSHQKSVLCEWGPGALWILSWEWVSHNLQDCLLGSLQLGLPHCAWNPKETALNIAFLRLHGGRSADKIRIRLEGQKEWNFHSGVCRQLRAT